MAFNNSGIVIAITPTRIQLETDLTIIAPLSRHYCDRDVAKSGRVFETYDAIIDAACDAWSRLTDQPDTITSIGMREWAHVDQAL
jgi:hypothetical protein